MVDRGDAVVGEELGEQAHHHRTVLEHVGDARGRAQVVFEDVEVVGIDAHDVDTGDVRIDPARRVEALHLGPELIVVEDEVFGDAPGPDDLLVVVDVVQEHVERAHALDQAALEAGPFLRGQHARDDVERDQAFGIARVFRVDREGDAEAAEQKFGLFAPAAELGLGRRRQPAFELAVGLADGAALVAHFVEHARGGVSAVVGECHVRLVVRNHCAPF